MEIKFTGFDPGRDAEELADVYAAVFAGPPWNEVTRCPVMPGRFFGSQTQPGQDCPDCLVASQPKRTPLEVAYPKQEMVEYFAEETTKDGSLALIGRPNSGPDQGRIVAFTWMYNYPDVKDFVKDKYQVTRGDVTGLRFQVRLIQLLEQQGIAGKFGYFSESGILPDYRGNGLSNEFWTRRWDWARSQGIPALQRTRWDSPMTIAARKIGFEQLLGPRSEPFISPDGTRGIRQTGQVVNGLIDQINQDRVLFRSPR
ncbi:hypothetical protein A2631_00880 [Candidatus Daviesbacteria bacterium RIFCSPHIGHO2_01_FULL_44_29]|uniref:N-acetyltransferase domain-containing protein n=1 Tax=Candidatus Daviesbacteria bacterium RIFCSPHIGHO2_02_FULL_43_12 TaxID=1797776 RepID=A0A1F5KH57_9BACT|nr:MAG: hypothetical protein A2631_00880 [Candidatus Daviesbacteria bacterium RIFCSPHIGHO2_01_FULL_44_29]OGE39298.1 MAG: hypothetical protein A3E86_00640 [Candidatus Daviesbacteria bacterium RIFCSPHIGHO2_12_FULL_47_45]OGE40273.1 MAG: hypothetical protein A3D25_05345 [Candidatus Daviesbacteria bacterium RIFCSPHIGHO2_02_FULL_43_12]OGE69072.1 MAG: hypothetical protein A3B55_02425 [Candidatus Daviesbacteria bacterium RIFCSPLOWO2_01_FULL_43_15]